MLRNLLAEDRFDIVFDSGFAVPVSRVTLEHIPMLIKAICIHSAVVLIKAELDQLSEGLKVFHLIDIVRKYEGAIYMQSKHQTQCTGDDKAV